MSAEIVRPFDRDPRQIAEEMDRERMTKDGRRRETLFENREQIAEMFVVVPFSRNNHSRALPKGEWWNSPSFRSSAEILMVYKGGKGYRLVATLDESIVSDAEMLEIAKQMAGNVPVEWNPDFYANLKEDREAEEGREQLRRAA